MNEIEKRKKLVDYINSMNDDEIVELHNCYCESAECEDDHIYSMYELDELLAGRTPTDILSMGFYGDFRPTHDFFWFNGCGNLESADYATDMPIFASDIADYILSEEDSLGNDEIQEILDEEDELQELATKIRAAKTWVEVEGELRTLCEAAGMADEYKAADGDSFEAVIYKAAERLGVEV